MENIEFQNNTFKVREIVLPEFGVVQISTNALNELLLNQAGSYNSKEAELLDENMFYFVEETEIALNNEELINIITSQII